MNAPIKKPVFKTIVEPSAEVVVELEGWKPPQGAYVLVEIPQRKLVKDGEAIIGKGLATINAESRPEVIHQVEALLNKRGRILHYGNFPKLADPNPNRAAKAMHYSQGSGAEPWAPLEKYLRMKMSGDVDHAAKRQSVVEENDALRAKLAAMEARIAAAEQVEKKSTKVGAAKAETSTKADSTLAAEGK